MLHTELCNGVHPVSVIIIHIIFSPFWCISNFRDEVVRRFVSEAGLLTRIEVCLLHVHGVVVTIEQLITLVNPVASETVVVADSRLTSHTALSLDFNDTICTFRTPNSLRSSILEDGDGLNIIRVHLQEFSEALVVGILIIEAIFHCDGVTVHNDKWVLVTMNGGYTTKTDSGTCTKVT